jgi:hypothetical protein
LETRQAAIRQPAYTPYLDRLSHSSPCAAAVVDLLADRAPGLLRALREVDPDYVLLDGTLAECDRVGDSRADFSHKHHRHGVNVQVVTDPAGKLLWISPALPGRVHLYGSRHRG